MAPRLKLLKEISPGKTAVGESPEVGPTYRAAYCAGGLDHAPSTCYELFK
jgi:hypothetical protein